MESLTKPKISIEQICAVFKRLYNAKPTSIREATNGWFGAVFFVELPTGHKVLKVAPSPSVPVLRYERDLLSAEVQVMGLVAESSTVPVPTVEFFVGQDSELGSPYMICQKLEGVTLGSKLKELTPEQRHQIDLQIGTILSQLHQIKCSTFGTFLGPHFPTWREAFSHLVADLKQDAIDASVQVNSAIFDLFDKYASSLDGVLDASLVHWDMWDENILIDPETLTITGVVDFERAMWGDPLLEWNFKDASKVLLENSPHIPQDNDAQTRRNLYSLYLGLILVIETTYRGFNDEHLAWCRGEVAKAVASLED